MNRREWLEHGIEKGWVSNVWCWVHDAPTLTDEEVAEVEANGDDLDAICVPALRVNP